MAQRQEIHYIHVTGEHPNECMSGFEYQAAGHTPSLARQSTFESRDARCHPKDLEVTGRAEESDGQVHVTFAGRIQIRAGDAPSVVIDDV